MGLWHRRGYEVAPQNPRKTPQFPHETPQFPCKPPQNPRVPPQNPRPDFGVYAQNSGWLSTEILCFLWITWGFEVVGFVSCLVLQGCSLYWPKNVLHEAF